MKKTIKISITILILIVIVSIIAGYFFLSLKAKDIVVSQLEKFLNRKVKLDAAILSFPLNLELKKINIEGLVQADSIFISPSINGLIARKITLNKISLLRPKVKVEISEQGNLNLAFLPPTSGSSPEIQSKDSKPDPPPAKQIPVFIKYLVVKNGQLELLDKKIKAEGLKLQIKDINVKLVNLANFPSQAVTRFNIKGKIPWAGDTLEGKIEANGWLNLFKKDIQANLKIYDIDGIYLHPYYANWVDLEKSRIEKAKLNFLSDITGKNNDVIANCRLELTDIVFTPRPPEQEAEKAEKIATAVLGIFKTLNEGKIVLNFTVKTKLDVPRFGVDSIRSAVDETISKGQQSSSIVEEIIKIPGKITKEAIDVPKAVIEKSAEIGKELKKALEGAFKREKPEEE